MKKIILLSFCVFGVLLAWCEDYNHFSTYNEKTTWCEKWILSHWTDNADFERKWSEKNWDITVITWIQYSNNGYSNKEIKCEFNGEGKLLWIQSSTLENKNL